MEFFRQEYWNGLLFPSPGDLPNLGMETCLLRLTLSSGIFYHWITRGAHSANRMILKHSNSRRPLTHMLSETSLYFRYEGKAAVCLILAKSTKVPWPHAYDSSLSPLPPPTLPPERAGIEEPGLFQSVGFVKSQTHLNDRTTIQLETEKYIRNIRDDMGCTKHSSTSSTEIDDPLYLRRYIYIWNLETWYW